MTVSTEALEGAPQRALDPRRVRAFRRLAVWACAATYLLIWVGGLVRVSGAGLGCPDWPKCFGRWIPPTDISQVPADMAPLFNTTLAWIEYVNRLVGVVIGFLILATAVVALSRLRSDRLLVWGSVSATILVAIQGYLGSVVVSSLLEPWIVTMHFLLALVIISILVGVAVRAWRLENPEDGQNARYPPGTRAALALVWLLALVQIGAGTQLRGMIERQLELFPLLADRALIRGLGWWGHSHLALGVLIAAFAAFVCWRILRRASDPSWLVRFGASATLGLVLLQIVIGLGFVFFGVPPIVQLFHSWIPSLLVGSLLILWAGTDTRTSP